MREEPAELNPYASPVAEVPQAGDARKRFRWRVIPVTLLCVFGGLALVARVIILGTNVWWRIRNPDAADLGIGPTVPMLVGDLFALIAVGLWLLTALRLWQGRWWSAAAAFLLAVFLLFLYTRLNGLG